MNILAVANIGMQDWLYALLGVYIVLFLMLIPCIILCNGGAEWFFTMLPWDLHDSGKMNWFGCVLASLVLFILFPPYWIGRFIYWLCHV